MTHRLNEQFGGTLGIKKKKGVFDKADDFLNSTGGNFLLNLAAQSGFSPVPGSPLGAVGRAGVASQEQLRERSFDDLNKQFIESQIGRNKSLSAAGPNPQSGNVQTSFKGANGNMHIITRSGDTKDTGIPFNSNVEFFKQADGSVIGVDKSTGQRLGEVITPKEAADADRRNKEQDAAFSLPKDLAGLDSTISKVDRTIANVQEAIEQVTPGTTGIRGALTSGIPGTKSKALKNQIKTVQANLGFDTLTSMRAASKTGGALGQVSERELDLLISAVESLDPELDDATLTRNLNAVVEHYENYKREIEIMKDKLREQAGQPTEPTNEFEGFSIVPNTS